MCYFCTPLCADNVVSGARIFSVYLLIKNRYMDTHSRVCIFRAWPALEWSGKREKESETRKKFMLWRIFRGAGWKPCDWKIALKNYFLAGMRSVAQSKVNEETFLCLRHRTQQKSKIHSNNCA